MGGTYNAVDWGEEVDIWRKTGFMCLRFVQNGKQGESKSLQTANDALLAEQAAAQTAQ